MARRRRSRSTTASVRSIAWRCQCWRAAASRRRATWWALHACSDGRLIWINELNWYLERHGPAARGLVGARIGVDGRSTKAQIIRMVIEGCGPGAIEALLAELRAAFGPAEVMERLHLDRAEIVEMAGRGFRFGNHTATHPALSLLDDGACRAEIDAGRVAISGLPGAIRLARVPVRAGESRRGAAIARELGYGSLMGVDGVGEPSAVDAVPRISVGDDSPAVLFARMEVIAPLRSALGRVRRWLRPPAARPLALRPDRGRLE